MSQIKWTRQPDGSYASEAGRVRRLGIQDIGPGGPTQQCTALRPWLWLPCVPYGDWCSAHKLADAKENCAEAYRRHRLATMPAPPPREILQAVIARVEAKCLPDPVVLEALRACQHLVGLPPALADALTVQWRQEQAAERRRLGL